MKELPLPSKKRLLTLSNLLSQQPQEKIRITSAEIAKLTGWGEATIRRDISLLELHTGKSNGYELKSLKTEIDKNLGLIKIGGEKHNCCIVVLELSCRFERLVLVLVHAIVDTAGVEACVLYTQTKSRIEFLSQFLV